MTDSTRWTLIQGAAKGNRDDREEFARRYEPVVRAYLGARWRGGPWLGEIDDAAQEVFVACFQGALDRVDPDAPGKFRNYLFGVTRNVARQIETKRARRREQQPKSGFDIEADDAPLSAAFDRAWASGLLKRAARLHASRAGDDEARRRVELLRLRFGEDLPIRAIAERWGEEAALVHRAYAKARREFQAALKEIVLEEEGEGADADAECERLIGYFS